MRNHMPARVVVISFANPALNYMQVEITMRGSLGVSLRNSFGVCLLAGAAILAVAKPFPVQYEESHDDGDSVPKIILDD